ncbi:RES family NAD+ phosphorylase [Parvularcula oceani]|uniref:RES family NAD+ phosphorylase n=1 Tax=Parvularcula oceani TaxID=1247963 RepID=UPI000565C31C|nr:RES family NAD+ phosphorylase [Parvularcula oceani]
MRLIPTRFPPIAAFDDVARAEDLDAVMELEGWTNDRLVAERAARIPPAERVYGRPNSSIVMAAFLHASPAGGRFSGPELGAWYASLTERAAIAEVAAGLRREARRAGLGSLGGTYRAYLATLEGDGYADLRGAAGQLPAIYDPSDWSAGQRLGERLRADGADGIVYDSVRLLGGVNVAAFRPYKIVEVVVSSTFSLEVPATGRITARRLS